MQFVPNLPSGPNHYVATAAAAATTTQGRTSLCRTAKAINVGAAPEWVQHTPMAAAAWRGSLDSELLLSSLPGQTRGNGNRFSRLGRKKSSILLSAGACCCSSQSQSVCVRLLPSLARIWDYRRRIASNRFIVVCNSSRTGWFLDLTIPRWLKIALEL